MATKMALLFLSFLFCFASVPFIADAVPIVSEPQAFPSFNLGLIQKAEGFCPYTVIITTSCLSPPSTGDHISIAFGDADGNQVYAPRLDGSGASETLFDKCSSDTFQIKGQCTNEICYVYFYRTGHEGWIPETVEIYAEGSKAVKFDFNRTVPENTWYGHNFCNYTGPPPPLFPPFPPSVPPPPPPPQPPVPPPPPPPVPPPPPSAASERPAGKLLLLGIVVAVVLTGAALAV